MKSRLLFIDTETGGINPQKHSLLSVGFVVWDIKEGVLYSNEYYIRSGAYSVTSEAAKINHFDEARQNRLAVDPGLVISQLYELRSSYFQGYSAIPLAGHNICFDVQFIKQLFASCNRSYDKLFSHRLVDTHSILKYLSDCQLIPDSVDSSASAFNFFGIKVDGRHSAIGDAMATAQLYSKLIDLILNKQQ